MSLRTDDTQHLTGSTKVEDSGGTKTRPEEVVKSAMMEPCTLQWPADRQTGGQTGTADGMSARSDLSLREAASWTESQRELRAEGGGAGEGAGLVTHLEEEEEPVENQLPEKAAQVFSPAVTVLQSPSSPRGSEAFWEVQSEKSPFLGPRGVPEDYNQDGFQYDWTEDPPPAACKYTCLLPCARQRWAGL